MKKAPYVAGEKIEFQREAGLPWESGEYVEADDSPYTRGRHFVLAETGFREGHHIPTRRLRRRPADTAGERKK